MATMIIKLEEYTKLVNTLEVIRFVKSCIEKDKYMTNNKKMKNTRRK